MDPKRTPAAGPANEPADEEQASPPSQRPQTRIVLLDRSLETLPVFRLSDSSEETAIVSAPDSGGRWRVLPSPGDRLPGTFDQDVYVEICRRFNSAGMPADGVLYFTLHAFLRSIGRRADGRTYEQLRSALTRLSRTTLESTGAYWSATAGQLVDVRFSFLSGVTIDRRRTSDRDQMPLFDSLASFEPGAARIVISPQVRSNIVAGHVSMLSAPQYFALSSPVARRLYRILEAVRADGLTALRLTLAQLAERIPLSQHHPSHLNRVLQPAHEMLLSAGIVRAVQVAQTHREWTAEFTLPTPD